MDHVLVHKERGERELGGIDAVLEYASTAFQGGDLVKVAIVMPYRDLSSTTSAGISTKSAGSCGNTHSRKFGRSLVCGGFP